MPGGGGGMGRVLGLGFLFGAKDEGAIRMTEDIGEGMENMTRAVRETGQESVGVQRLGNFINALNLSQLTRVSGALEGLAERAGALSGEISSTSLESHGAQFAQEYRAATAGLGEYRGEVDAVRGQISSLSFSLGVGSEGMLNYATSVARAGRSVEDYGLSMRDIAGLEQAGITNGQELARTMTELDIGFGLGADGAARLTNEIVAIGTRVGSGREALGQMRQAVEAASAAIVRLPEGVEASVDDSVRSMTFLAAGAQRILGGTFEDAMQGAVGAFNSIAEARQQLGGVFTGMSSDFPELATGMARAFGSVEGSLNAMMTTPDQFVMEMQRLYATLDPATAARFQQEVLNRLPDSINYMIQAGEEGRAAMEEITQPLGDVENAVSDMAQGASGSTRTFAEAMDLLNERFQHQMNSMVRSFPGYQNFERNVLQRQRESYERLGGAIRNLASKQTGIGALTRTFMAFRRGGFQGLMIAMGRESTSALNRIQEGATEANPALGAFIGRLRESGSRARESVPWMGALGDSIFEIAGQAMPAATALGAMGLRFQTIGRGLRFVTRSLGPFMLFIGLAAGIYYLSRNLDQVQQSLGRVATGFRNFGRNVLEFSTLVDWEQLGTDIVDGVIGAFQSLAGIGEGREMSETSQAIAEGFRSLFQGVARIVRGLAVGMWDRIVEWIMEPPDMEARVGRAGTAAGVGLGVALLTPLRSGILGAFSRVFSGIGRFLTGGRALGGGALRMILRRIPYVGAIIGVLFDLPQIIESFNTDGITSGFRTLFSSIVNGLLFGIPRMLGSALGGVDITGGLFDFLMDLFNVQEIVGFFQSGDILRGIVEAIYSMPGVNLGRMLMEHILGEDVVSEYLDGVAELWRSLGGEISDGFNTWLGYITPLFDEWMGVFREIGGVLGELWSDTIAPLLEDIFGFSLDTEGVGGAFEGAQEGVSGFGDILQRVLHTVMPMIQWLHRTAMPLVVQGIREWADHIRRVVAVVRFLWRVGRRVFPWVVSAVENVIEGFRVWWGAVNFMWSRVIRPVFRFIWRLFQRVFLRGILPAAIRVFRTIGSIVRTVWRRVIRPVFNALWTVWSTVIGNVVDAARRAFNYVRDFITNRIRAAVQIFQFLRRTWHATVGVLRAGFELVGAGVERYLVVPFLRVGNTLMTLGEGATTTFMRLKMTVMQVFHTILSSIQELVERIPGIRSLLRGTFTETIGNLQTAIATTGEEVTSREQRYRQEQQQRQQRMAAAEERLAQATEDMARAQTAWDDAASREVREPTRDPDPAPTRPQPGVAAPPAVPGAAAPPPPATPVAPSTEEADVGARRAATRREGAVAGEQQREARQIAEEMAISGFSAQAKRDMTEAMRAALPRPPPRGGGRADPTETETGLGY